MLVSKKSQNGIFYTEIGQGPVLVFLHGFMESTEIWKNFTQELSKEYKAVCVDLPGHGSSQLDENASIDSMAKSIHEVLKNYDPFVLIGHSMGGYVALSYARMFPNQIRGLSLFHSSVSADSDEKKVDRLRAVDVVLQNKKSFITSLAPKLFALKNRERMSDKIVWVEELCAQTSNEGIVAALHAMRTREEKSDVLRELAVPALFIAGLHDDLIPLNVVLPQSLLAKKSICFILSNSGHMGFMEEPKECQSVIDQFSKQCYRMKE